MSLNNAARLQVYEHILNANKRFGTDQVDIASSVFKCEPEMIRKDVIIAPEWKPDLFAGCVDGINQVCDGIYQIWNLSTNKKTITYIRTGIGAPNVLEAVLALGCTSCENIIFIGSVGGLDEKLRIGDIVIPEYSISGDGSCRYLTDKKVFENDCFGEKYFPNEEFHEKVISKTENIAKENNVNWHTGKNFSIDTVIAQFAHIDEILDMGCNCIEMETAALFKSAEICGIKACAVFNVSDNTVLKKSLLSGRSKEEMEFRKYTRKNILTKIVLESFL